MGNIKSSFITTACVGKCTNCNKTDVTVYNFGVYNHICFCSGLLEAIENKQYDPAKLIQCEECLRNNKDIYYIPEMGLVQHIVYCVCSDYEIMQKGIPLFNINENFQNVVTGEQD